MSDRAATVGPLLPSVSIVEQTMRQARHAVAITLLTTLLLAERLRVT